MLLSTLAPQATSGRGEIPSLYGIRGIAALAVVFAHVIPGFAVAGSHAVICFFVLSGFLITGLLLKEHRRTGTIALRAFYWRRSFRIFPAAMVFLVVLGCISLVSGRGVPWAPLAAAAFYVSNYWLAFGGAGAGTGHTWSLAVEEQFYLLWPFVFRRYRNRLIPVLVGVTVTAAVLRCVLVAAGVSWEYTYRAFELRADALAVGCLLALMEHRNRIPGWLQRTAWPSAVCVSLIILLGIFDNFVLSYNVSAVAFAVIIYQAAHFAPSALNTRGIKYLGGISYSLYLYHLIAAKAVPHSLPLLVQVPLAVVVAILLAMASYHFVEQPLLRMRDRGVKARSVARASAA